MPVFNSDSYTLSLPVGTATVTPSLARLHAQAQELGIEPKEEFHITVIGFQVGKKIKDLYTRSAPRQRQEVEEALVQLAQGIDWKFTLKNDFYYIEKEYTFKAGKELRRTVVQPVDMPGMEIFYREINAALGTNFPTPLPHVTLLTVGGKGIGIDSQKDFDALKPTKLSLV